MSTYAAAAGFRALLSLLPVSAVPHSHPQLFQCAAIFQLFLREPGGNCLSADGMEIDPILCWTSLQDENSHYLFYQVIIMGHMGFFNGYALI